MATLFRNIGLTLVFAVALAACGGDSDGDIAAGASSTTADSIATTTTEPATTTEAPATTVPTTTTTEAPTTTQATTTTVVEIVDDEAAIVEYCLAHDEVDAFFDADFPEDDELADAIDGQQALLASMTAPDESLETANESYTGALIEFYTVFEDNGYEIADDEFAEIFSTLNVRLAEQIINRYRLANCDGYEGAESEIVSGSFSFEPSQCINQSASGDFDEVGCDEPHDYQVYALFDVAENDGEFPGPDQLVVEAESKCIEEFEPFVGVSFSQSIYYVTTLRPTPGSWSFGDREIVCLLQAEVGQLSKDIEGSGE